MRIAFALSVAFLCARCATPPPSAPPAEAAAPKRAVVIAIRPFGAAPTQARQSIVAALATDSGADLGRGDQVEMIVMGADGRAVSLVQARDGLRPGDLVTLTGQPPFHAVRAGNQAP